MAGPIKINGGIVYICSTDEIGNWEVMVKHHQEEKKLEHYSLQRQHDEAVSILSQPLRGDGD